MKVGTAKVRITPPVGIDLAGFVAREQPSTGILDDLWLRALFLDHAGERLLWLHADLLGFARETVAEIRGALADAYGLEARHVLVSATHTHSAPATVRLRQCGALDPAYVAGLVPAALRAAGLALAAPEPAVLEWAEGCCDLAVDRRPPSPHSHTDPRLPVLTVRARTGRLAAILANYAIHNVTLGAANRLVSADLAGAVVTELHRDLPAATLIMMTNGGCGNLNPPALDPDPAVMQGFAEALADAVCTAMRETEPAEPALASVRRDVVLPLSPLDPEGVAAEHARRVADLDAEPAAERIRRAMDSWRDETLAEIAAGTLPTTIATEIHAVRIGPCRFVALGAEIFSCLADELRAKAGADVYVVGYANGLIGYVPPEPVYAEGGYEVDNAWKYYATAPIAPGGHERLRDVALELLREL